MKNILFFIVVIQVLFSCKRKIEDNQIDQKDKITTNEEIYGDSELNKIYNSLSNVEVINDSLKGNNFFNQILDKVSCKCNIKRDYGNDIENLMIRETEILIKNKIKLSAFRKNEEKYIFTYNGTPFKVKNYFDERYNSDSEIHFFFDTRECYEISKNKYLMREQPSSWCGIANQYEFYQIVDLDKMELIQFVERDDRIK
jgi:hypothetical protein